MIIEDALPYPYTFEENSCALLIMDMQRDIVEPGGYGESLGYNVAPLMNIVPAVSTLLDCFRYNNLCIIHTRECYQPDLSDCPPSKLNRGSPALRIGDSGPMGRILIDGEPGTDIIDVLLPLPDELVVTKPGKGAFYNTELESILESNGITHLIVAGVTTELSVQSTLCEASDRGYHCLLATDATASYFPEFKQATIGMIQAQGGLEGWTATIDQVADALPL